MSDTKQAPEPEEMRRRIGISRRELIRRGAIVGGTLAWTVPVIRSLSQAHPRGSPVFFCCFCRKPRQGPHTGQGLCIDGPTHPSECAEACHEAGWTSPEFHSGPTPIDCTALGGCEDHHGQGPPSGGGGYGRP